MAGSNMVEHKLRLLIETQLDEKQKQQVGKQLKNILEGAAIGFDEAETKRNLEPIIRMMKRLFDKAEIAFDADQLLAMPSRQALQKMAEIEVDQLQMAFDKALAKSGGVKIDFGNVDLSSMTAPLEKLTQELSEIGERVASTTKKSVDEIEKSLRSLSKNKEFKKIASTTSIESTLTEASDGKVISPSRAIERLEKARDLYSESVKEDNPWVVQYKYLLEFVSKYEKLSDKARSKVEHERPEFKQLYDMLSPKAGAVKISLEHYVDVAKGNELSEYKNQPWAREGTLKKIEQTLKAGITVKDGPGGNYGEEASENNTTPPWSDEDNKEKKLNTKVSPAKTSSTDATRAEAEIKVNAEQEALKLAKKRRIEEEKITKAIKERKPYTAYRAVESPEDSGKSKRDAIDDFGGEYWSTTREAAESYANNHYGTSSLISAQIKPINPLIIDANELQWNDFENIPGLKEFFPGLLDIIRESKFPDDEAQKYINEQAGLAGFDSVIFKNVQDNFDADLDEDAPITDTIAVLDDRIVSLTGAFTELEETTPSGNKMFSEAPSDIPEYYVTPGDAASDQYLSDLREKQAKSQEWYNDTISRLQDTLKQQEEELNAAQQKLKENPKSYTAQESARSALEAVDATDDLITNLQRAQAIAQKTFQVEIEAFTKTSDVVTEVASDVQVETAAHQENATAIIAETQAQKELNESIKEKDVIESADNGHTEVSETNAETEAINRENEALKENIALRAQADEQAFNVAPQSDSASDAESTSSKPVEVKATIEAEELRSLLSAITYNVKVVQDVEPTENNKISIDESALESVLNRITYNVKIAHDDADKTANKIAIDESALESTLKRVFTNVLNPEAEQPETEPKNEPWALEKTLLSIKEVLDGIRTNTAKTDLVEVAPASTEVGNVLATENTLAAIKTAVEAINKKVVKGTKAKTSEGDSKKKSGAGKKNAESYAGSQYFPEKIKTQTMYLAKFRAQLMTTGKLTDDVDAQIYQLLDGLKQVQNGPDLSKWTQQFLQLKTSVGIEDIFEKAEDKVATASYEELIELQRTRNKLELQYEKAQDGSPLKQFYAEQLAQIDGVIVKQEKMLENEEYELKLAKMREEQARKLGEAEAKAANKVAKKAAADQKKLDKRRAMMGKAGGAIGRAEGVWLEAEGLEQAKLPEDFKKQVSEYYDALDQLRLKHHEINTSEVVTDEQQAELIAQTKEVNRLTEDIGSLVAEYQKLSGSNVDEADSRATTLTGKSGLSEYETTLKQYVREITDGKGQIKSFNAETKTLNYTVKTGKNEFTEYTAAVRSLDHQLVSVQGTTKRTETFLEATTRKMRELTSYFSGMAIFNRVGQELRRGIQYVREIDLALTELKKVTDETEESYDKFLKTAAKTGARLGTTISAVTEATATFAKLGYTMEQATEMAEAAIVYKNVGDNIESTGDAADSIISTMKGFRLEASESMAIVDRFNEVGNRFAITSQGIGEALRLSASALSEGGNSLDESIALITAANEVVNDPSSVGTALKTLTLRLRGSKTELEEMGEDVSDMATTTSQLQAKLLALTGGQVDIMLDANTFKNSTQILREMADAWEDMNDIQRAERCPYVQKCA